MVNSERWKVVSGEWWIVNSLIRMAMTMIGTRQFTLAVSSSLFPLPILYSLFSILYSLFSIHYSLFTIHSSRHGRLWRLRGRNGNLGFFRLKAALFFAAIIGCFWSKTALFESFLAKVWGFWHVTWLPFQDPGAAVSLAGRFVPKSSVKSAY